MGGIGFSELLLIFIVVMVLFGAKKLPEFARSLGQALKEFRRAAREIDTYTTPVEEEKTPELKAVEDKKEEVKQSA